MELGQHQQPFVTPEHASTSKTVELTTINAEELANILLSDSFDCIVLDCRPPGTLPVSNHSHLSYPGMWEWDILDDSLCPTNFSPNCSSSALKQWNNFTNLNFTPFKRFRSQGYYSSWFNATQFPCGTCFCYISSTPVYCGIPQWFVV